MRDQAPLRVLLLLAAGCVPASQPIPQSTPQTVPNEWMSVPAATRIGSVMLAEDGKVTTSPDRSPARLSDGSIRVVMSEAGLTLMNGDKVLAEDLGAIDSLDLSEVRAEVAFSARRETGFDEYRVQ